MASWWCPLRNHRKHLLRYDPPSLLCLIHSIIPRFLVRILDARITVEPSFLILKRMFAVNLVVIVESIHSIVTHKADDVDRFYVPAVASVASALGWSSTYLTLIYQTLMHRP